MQPSPFQKINLYFQQKTAEEDIKRNPHTNAGQDDEEQFEDAMSSN